MTLTLAPIERYQAERLILEPMPKRAYKLSLLLVPASAASWALMALSSEVVLDVCIELKSPAGVRLMLDWPELELPVPPEEAPELVPELEI